MFGSCELNRTQAARAQYLDLQSKLRRELGLKKLEKTNDKLIEDILWGVPDGSAYFKLLHNSRSRSSVYFKFMHKFS